MQVWAWCFLVESLLQLFMLLWWSPTPLHDVMSLCSLCFSRIISHYFLNCILVPKIFCMHHTSFYLRVPLRLCPLARIKPPWAWEPISLGHLPLSLHSPLDELDVTSLCLCEYAYHCAFYDSLSIRLNIMRSWDKIFFIFWYLYLLTKGLDE